MKMYHGTTKEKWELIKSEGVLWGERGLPSRCTYLTPDINEAKSYGDIILEVEYNPEDGVNNYSKDSWQVREYNAIGLNKITLINQQTKEQPNDK